MKFVPAKFTLSESEIETLRQAVVLCDSMEETLQNQADFENIAYHASQASSSLYSLLYLYNEGE